MSAHPKGPTPRTEKQRRELDEYVARVVAAAPPLTPAQKDKLVTIFRREGVRK